MYRDENANPLRVGRTDLLTYIQYNKKKIVIDFCSKILSSAFSQNESEKNAAEQRSNQLVYVTEDDCCS